MSYPKLKFVYELIFTILMIPIMVGAILKSTTLIGVDYNLTLFKSIFMQNYGGPIMYIILLLNMIFALASIIILFLNLAFINNKNPSLSNFDYWASMMIKLCALSNMFVIGFISQTSNMLTELKPTLLLWTITFTLSVAYSIIKLRRKNS
jgi:hypothetical protein